MWFSRRAWDLHVVIIVIVPTFITLCVWQLRRALSGNELSWAYVFEWPFFAGYAIYMWWRFVHEVPEAQRSSAPAPPSASEEAERAAYNEYLTELAEQDQPKRW